MPPGGVHHPEVVAPQGRVAGYGPDEVAQQVSRAAQTLVVAGLAGQIREQVPQVPAGISQPTGLGGEAQQGLHDRQGD